MKQTTILSSNGSLTIDETTGKVLNVEMNNEGEGIDEIARFDVAEFRKHYGYSESKRLPDIDILDIGYWTNTGQYEEPEADYRKEIQLAKQEA